MPKNGRPAIPNGLKLLKGETRPGQLNPNEPQAKPGIPNPPANLNKNALKVWKAIAPQLDEMGILTHVDQIVLGLLCQEVARHAELTKMLEESSPMITDDRGKTRKNPLMQLLRDSTMLIARLSYEFGMTPSARAKLTVVPGDGPTDLEGLLM